jgi:hypothetical protein
MYGVTFHWNSSIPSEHWVFADLPTTTSWEICPAALKDLMSALSTPLANSEATGNGFCVWGDVGPGGMVSSCAKLSVRDTSKETPAPAAPTLATAACDEDTATLQIPKPRDETYTYEVWNESSQGWDVLLKADTRQIPLGETVKVRASLDPVYTWDPTAVTEWEFTAEQDDTCYPTITAPDIDQTWGCDADDYDGESVTFDDTEGLDQYAVWVDQIADEPADYSTVTFMQLQAAPLTLDVPLDLSAASSDGDWWVHYAVVDIFGNLSYASQTFTIDSTDPACQEATPPSPTVPGTPAAPPANDGGALPVSIAKTPAPSPSAHAAQPARQRLPFTGAEGVGPIAAASAALLLVGAVLLAARRRKIRPGHTN